MSLNRSKTLIAQSTEPFLLSGYYLKMLPITVENAINRFRAEKELKEYHENLEKLVGERILNIISMNRWIIKKCQKQTFVRKNRIIYIVWCKLHLF
ncbi:MAG: hypothetical protein J7L96_03845 [Bacteroidales bacterium]|nr:hypothetical protein [Bacteroidales bacterium]